MGLLAFEVLFRPFCRQGKLKLFLVLVVIKRLVLIEVFALRLNVWPRR